MKDKPKSMKISKDTTNIKKHIISSMDTIELLSIDSSVIRYDLNNVSSPAKFAYYVPTNEKLIFQFDITICIDS